MIKVNLMRNKVADTAVGGTSVRSSGGGGGEGTREALIKVAFILLFTLGLMMYESQNIRELNEETSRIQAMVRDLEVQAKAKATEVDSIKDIAKQAQELEDKLKVLKLLSKLRLREVKTLDFMQSSIPEKVWLKGIRYETDKDLRERTEAGRYQFQGNSVTTEDLSDFVKRLEDSAYLSEVIVIQNQESTGPARGGGGLREFQFTAEVEVKN
jgi:Tfp pilus assembly protein PilN